MKNTFLSLNTGINTTVLQAGPSGSGSGGPLRASWPLLKAAWWSPPPQELRVEWMKTRLEAAAETQPVSRELRGRGTSVSWTSLLFLIPSICSCSAVVLLQLTEHGPSFSSWMLEADSSQESKVTEAAGHLHPLPPPHWKQVLHTDGLCSSLTASWWRWRHFVLSFESVRQTHGGRLEDWSPTAEEVTKCCFLC